jgi:mono/diheme cytochrome c family protein
METTGFKRSIIVNAIVGFGTCASAQDIDIGKMEYQSSCAACHGIDLKGTGPVSKDLKTPPTDLTVLAKNHNGVFPYDMVYEIIDGRNWTISSAVPVKCRFGDTGSGRHKHSG